MKLACFMLIEGEKKIKYFMITERNVYPGKEDEKTFSRKKHTLREQGS